MINGKSIADGYVGVVIGMLITLLVLVIVDRGKVTIKAEATKCEDQSLQFLIEQEDQTSIWVTSDIPCGKDK